MIRLWRHTGFDSPAEAVRRCQAAYPHAPDDAHLEQFIAEMARRST